MKAPESAPLAGTVERWKPGAETALEWVAVGGPEVVSDGGLTFRADALPAVVARTGKARYILLLALVDDDLACFGLSLQPELCAAGLGEDLLTELAAIARATARQGVRIPITNADVIPFSFLQMKGFEVAEVHPLEERGGRGYAGISRSHALVLRMEV